MPVPAAVDKMEKVSIQVIGSPIACSEGIRDDWRDITKWMASKLEAMYGDRVVVEYFDLFDGNCPAIPADAKLPLIKIDGQILTMGEKISIPRIRQYIEGKIGIS